jgi:hypothetical protein
MELHEDAERMFGAQRGLGGSAVEVVPDEGFRLELAEDSGDRGHVEVGLGHFQAVLTGAVDESDHLYRTRQYDGSVLTKMSPKHDSETQRQYGGAQVAPGFSLRISPISLRDDRRKITPATGWPANSYKKTLAP